MATEEVNKPRALPPYPEMILRAIEALNDPNGSNKSSISKYIESTYGDLPAGHTNLLSHHLNKMKDSGLLVFWKNNYMKRDPNAPPRRGRGRPPKPKDPSAPTPNSGPTRPRGRPPKEPNAPLKPNQPVQMKVSSTSSSGSGKPRGRPRKVGPASGYVGGVMTGGIGTSTEKPRGRGRPPKVKTPLNEVNFED